MSNDCGNNLFFGQVQQHIKPYYGNFVAVEGSNIVSKLTKMSSLKIPYQQVMTARIVLKAGQTNQLLNVLSMGDNFTFLALIAEYDTKSKFEADNYIQYSYFSNKSTLYTFSHILILSGNSENRIEQLYLHNPNPNTPVVIEAMGCMIDENYTFFNEQKETSTPASVTYENLKYDDIVMWSNDIDGDDSINDIIAVLNSYKQAILYIDIDDINSIGREGKILTIDDSSNGQIYLVFINEYHAIQASSRISFMIENRKKSTDDLNPPADDLEPIVVFTNNVSLTNTVPYGSLTSKDGTDFEANILDLEANGGVISKTFLVNFLISEVIDSQDGNIAVDKDSIRVEDLNGNELEFIFVEDTYYVFFEITDLAGNSVRKEVNVKLVIE